MKKEIIPAVLAKKKEDFKKQLARIRKYSKQFQIDVADGKFVPNKTLQAASLKDMKLDNAEIHLMTVEPEKQIIDWRYLGAEKIIFHYEACSSDEKINHVINFIRRNKLKAGIALNPKTPAEKIKAFLEKIDTILVMTVNPGWQNQKFLESQLKKIEQIRKWNKKIDIEVDGGINPDTINMVAETGANKFCVGSYLVKSKNFKKSLDELKKAIR